MIIKKYQLKKHLRSIVWYNIIDNTDMSIDLVF